MQRMVTRYLEQKTLNQKTNPVVPAFKHKGIRNRRNRRLQQWSPKVNVPVDKLAFSSLIQHKKSARKYTKNPFFISSPKDHRYRWQTNGTPNKPLCFKFEHGKCDKEKTCESWHPPGCVHRKRGTCNEGSTCPSLHPGKEKNANDKQNRQKGSTCPTGPNERTPDALMF